MVKHLQEFVFPDTILSWNWQERYYEWREAPPKFGTKLPVGIDKLTSLTPHRIYALHAAIPFMLQYPSCCHALHAAGVLLLTAKQTAIE